MSRQWNSALLSRSGSKQKPAKWSVFGKHMGALFTGSKSECLRFLAYVMREESGPFTISRKG